MVNIIHRPTTLVTVVPAQEQGEVFGTAVERRETAAEGRRHSEPLVMLRFWVIVPSRRMIFKEHGEHGRFIIYRSIRLLDLYVHIDCLNGTPKHNNPISGMSEGKTTGNNQIS